MKNVSGSAASWLQANEEIKSNSEITSEVAEDSEKLELYYRVVGEKRKEVFGIIEQLKASLKEYYEMDVNKRIGDALILTEEIERAL